MTVDRCCLLCDFIGSFVPYYSLIASALNQSADLYKLVCIHMTLPAIICLRGALFLLTPVKDLSEELKQNFSIM